MKRGKAKEHMEQECRFTKNVWCPGCSGFTSAADYRNHFDSCIPGDVWSSCNDGQLITGKFPKFNRDNQQSIYFFCIKLHGSDEIFFLCFKGKATENAYDVFTQRTMQADKDVQYTITCSITSGAQSRSYSGQVIPLDVDSIDPLNSMVVPAAMLEGDGNIELKFKIEKQN